MKDENRIYTREQILSALENKDLSVFEATPHRARLTAWRRICLHLFRHLARKFLAGRQPSGVIFIQSDEKSDCASAPPALCGVALIKAVFPDSAERLLFSAGITTGCLVQTKCILYVVLFPARKVSIPLYSLPVWRIIFVQAHEIFRNPAFSEEIFANFLQILMICGMIIV